MTQPVDDLLEAMTLEEKAWQLVGTYVGVGATESGGLIDLEMAKDLVADQMIGTVAAFGIGNSLHTTRAKLPRQQTTYSAPALEESRLGIPLMMPVDGVHGHGYIAGATVFPHNLGLAATFDEDLAERVAEVTAREVRATGGTQNYSPGTDVARDPRWGRTYETFGESPHLVSRLAAAKVRGYQGSDLAADDAVVATPKHFPAYSAPRRGEDASPVDISEYTLRRVFLPPFEATLAAGARSIMPCYNSLNGDPVHGSAHYLTELLREELGFTGYVVSDWSGVRMLESHHGTATDMTDAVRQTTTAGLDIASIGQAEHARELISLVETGAIPESKLDDSVRRVLSVKAEQGLFEDPYVDPDRCVEILGRADHRAVAQEATSRGITLLENHGLLPLEGVESISVTGHAADDMRVQSGGWSAVQEQEIPGTTVRRGARGHRGSRCCPRSSPRAQRLRWGDR
ncbi:MAG: glycoside hydrolase family 3 protein [Natrialbaceae archaeon]|nr:glycoside hydrolase family 3 protein [Natrialbaceae archaeon]